MELPGNLIEPLFERVEAYTKTSIELAKLKAVETCVSVATAFLPRLVVAFMLLMFVLVSSIGAALFWGELTGKLYYGFLLVAVIYLFAGLVFHLYLHNWIRKPVGDFIIKHLLQ